MITQIRYLSSSHHHSVEVSKVAGLWMATLLEWTPDLLREERHWVIVKQVGHKKLGDAQAEARRWCE